MGGLERSPELTWLGANLQPLGFKASSRGPGSGALGRAQGEVGMREDKEKGAWGT